jgi:DNA-binding response OmpR family regulator
MKALIIEDNVPLLTAMKRALKSDGFQCEISKTFELAYEKLMLYEYDVLIVDINLPDGTGLDLVRKIKKHNSQTGVIVVSARNSLENKIEGLNLGADDYITKPFEMAELIARVKSVLRRRKFEGKSLITYGEISIDPDQRVVFVNEQKADLTKSEFDILVFFVSNPTRVLSKEGIAEHIWGDNMDLVDSFDFIYSHIKNLRKKLIALGAQDPIKAVYGIGYKLKSL